MRASAVSSCDSSACSYGFFVSALAAYYLENRVDTHLAASLASMRASAVSSCGSNAHALAVLGCVSLFLLALLPIWKTGSKHILPLRGRFALACNIKV